MDAHEVQQKGTDILISWERANSLRNILLRLKKYIGSRTMKISKKHVFEANSLFTVFPEKYNYYDSKMHHLFSNYTMSVFYTSIPDFKY